MHFARSVSDRGGTDDAKLGVARIPGRIWRREARMIDQVEDVSPHLQFHGFLRRKLFVNAQVDVVNTVSAEAREVARRIARHLIPGIGKAIDVEKRGLINCRPVAADPHATTDRTLGR